MKRLERNHNIDYIKGIACILVIFIHYPFRGMFGEAIKAVGRIAVPLFFMISGYFLYGIDISKVKNRIWHIFKLTIGTYLFSFAIEVGLCSLREISIIVWCGKYLQKRQLVDLFLWNVCSWAEYLWFLPALLYCYICWYFVKKIGFEKKVTTIGTIGLLFLLLLNYIPKFGGAIPVKYYRNWLFMGLPFLIFGFWFRCNKEWIRRMSFRTLCIVLGGGLLLVIPERIFWGNCQIYFNTLLIVFGIFTIAQKKFRVKTNNMILFIGRELSMLIYIIHWYVRYVFYKVEAMFNLQTSMIWGYSSPILVALASVILAYGGYRIYLWKKKLKKYV